MVTLLDCIYRVPSVIEGIVARREETFAPLLDAVKDRLGELNEIMFIGSGTSNTCSLTAYRFVEKASKLSTSTMIPNEFLAKTVYNPKALYVFVSQSGTSTLTQQSLKKVKALGCLTAAITEAPTNPAGKRSGRAYRHGLRLRRIRHAHDRLLREHPDGNVDGRGPGSGTRRCQRDGSGGLYGRRAGGDEGSQGNLRPDTGLV